MEIRSAASTQSLTLSAKGDAQMAKLKGAIDAADSMEIITDYGKSFDLLSFPKGSTINTILANIFDLPVEDLGDISEGLEKGGRSVADFSKSIRDAGNEFATDSEDDANAIRKAYDDVADATSKAFTKGTLKGAAFYHHNVAEDGDTERRILMGQKKDGSWKVVSYSNFPF